MLNWDILNVRGILVVSAIALISIFVFQKFSQDKDGQ